MAWLSWILLESLPVLGGIVGLTWFGLLVHWRRSGSVRPLLVALVVGGVLLCVEVGYVTPREVAQTALTDLERDVRRERQDGFRRHLAADFEAFGMDRTTFIQQLAAVQRESTVEQLLRTALTLKESEADRFVVSGRYFFDIDARGTRAASAGSFWEFTFERADDGEAPTWRIRTIRSVNFDASAIERGFRNF